MPTEVDHLPEFAFYAILGTWMEEDVVADTVANAFAQGVERVFLVDNGSPDDTVGRAVAAGAEAVLNYQTDQFNEHLRITLMNDVVHHVSATSTHDHIWWLWLDADEFSRPEGRGTIRQFLQRLDRQYRVVGARVLNHYPSPGQVAYEPGTHPVTRQPLCQEVPQHICDSMHRKHPLQRWDRLGPRIDAGPGFHRAECPARPLLEPSTPIVQHHVPFRNEAFTRHRMDVLWRGKDSDRARAVEDDIATDHMRARRLSLDAVYEGAWGSVHNFIPGMPAIGVELTDWRDLDPPIHPELPAWDEPGRSA